MEITVNASLPAKWYMDINTGGLFERILKGSNYVLHRAKGKIIAAEAYLNNLSKLIRKDENRTCTK